MNEWDVLGRMLAALIAGGLIGLERTFRGRAAGMHTYALVAVGSALLVAATQYDLFSATHGAGDPTRVIQGIVTGIGFLGAGVIVKEASRYSARQGHFLASVAPDLDSAQGIAHLGGRMIARRSCWSGQLAVGWFSHIRRSNAQRENIKPFTTIAVVFLALLALLQAARFLLG